MLEPPLLAERVMEGLAESRLLPDRKSSGEGSTASRYKIVRFLDQSRSIPGLSSRCSVAGYNRSYLTVLRRKMRCCVLAVVVVAVCCFLALRVTADEAVEQSLDLGGTAIEDRVDGGAVHTREKRTLFLKKKLLGAGLLGFGLGIAKGYKAGYYSAPEVHHVYLSPPPLRYVQYVEKPVYIERIVPKPVYGPPPHDEYGPPHWSQPEPSPPYGGW